MTGALFECDFSLDELAVLADLLEIPALPGVDPDVALPPDAKAAAARGLLARRVVVADGAAGSVEITQPFATMIAMVMFAAEVLADDVGRLRYETDEGAVVVQSVDALSRWSVHRPGRDATWRTVAKRDGTSLTFEAGAT